MKNNKMKKIISMMVAILVVFSALTVHASATWYEFSPSDVTKWFANYESSSGSVSGGWDYFVDAETRAGDAAVAFVDVSLSWDTNVSPEFPPEYRCESVSIYCDSVSLSTSDYIASDYTIWGFSSSHGVIEIDGVTGEVFSIGSTS